MARPLISQKAILRYVYAIPHKRDEQYMDLISRTPPSEELRPYYEMKDFDYDPATKETVITFLETRITDRAQPKRWVTSRDFVYVGKQRMVEKTIFLTNTQLEQLNRHADPVIADFAKDIVIKMNDPQRYPSWFVAEMAEHDRDFEMQRANRNVAYYDNQARRYGSGELEAQKAQISNIYHLITQKNEKLSQITHRCEVIDRTIVTLKTSPRDLISGIFVRMKAKMQIIELQAELDGRRQYIQKIKGEIEELEQKVRRLENQLPPQIEVVQQGIEDGFDAFAKIQLKYERIISKIEPLPADEDELFFEERIL